MTTPSINPVNPDELKRIIDLNKPIEQPVQDIVQQPTIENQPNIKLAPVIVNPDFYNIGSFSVPPQTLYLFIGLALVAFMIWKSKRGTS